MSGLVAYRSVEEAGRGQGDRQATRLVARAHAGATPEVRVMAATEVDGGEEALVGARQGPGCTVVTDAVAAGPVAAGAVASVAVDAGRVGAVVFADLTG